MQQASRHDLARALAPRYAHASRREKGQLLDEFCALTGYTRKHALVLLSHPPAEERVWNRRGRPPSYGPAEVALLRVCWAATDGICATRLAPLLPELLQRLRRWHALEQVSAETLERVAPLRPATIDRALASSRDGLPKRGLSTTRPGTLSKHQVAIKTFADWTETVPGFVEVDLVAHCGWTGAGPFLYTLTLVDVATGWVSCAGLRDERAQTVLAAVRRLQAGRPFTLLGLDPDSGSEFLNTALMDDCADQRITFTRGRPYRKHDGCFVEQNNWAVVRRLVGSQRLEAPALAALERVHAPERDDVNCLHPVRRPTEQVRRGWLRVGTLWLYKSAHKWVLNFPTKEDWRRPSKPEFVQQGLEKFVETYEQQGITSVAFPALGCGNGGLDWENVVKPPMENYLAKLPIRVLIYPHRNTTIVPEHENPQEIARWLRSQPESLSFHEFWTDVVDRLPQPRIFSTQGNEYELALVDHTIRVRGGETMFVVDQGQMLDLWQQLRKHGFASSDLVPTALEGRVHFLLPLIAELPYVRRVKVGLAYKDITGPASDGLQFLPRIARSPAPVPRVTTLVESGTESSQTRLPV